MLRLKSWQKNTILLHDDTLSSVHSHKLTISPSRHQLTSFCYIFVCTGKRTVWKGLLPPWFPLWDPPLRCSCSLTQSSPRPDPDCCHSASYAQLLSVLEPISFLERTFRTFCHLFALLCIPAFLKSNFMKQSYTRSINNDKQLIVSRVFERLLLSLTTDTWALGHITVAPRDPHLSWQGCGHWLRTPGGNTMSTST